jgi:hypothetical protein
LKASPVFGINLDLRGYVIEGESHAWGSQRVQRARQAMLGVGF